jgi:hypothetical protein
MAHSISIEIVVIASFSVGFRATYEIINTWMMSHFSVNQDDFLKAVGPGFPSEE